MRDERVPRRAVLAGAGAAGMGVVLSACQSYGGGSGSPDPAPAPPADTGTDPTKAADPTSKAPAKSKPAAAPPLATTADIPVGGGKIFAAQGVVITQPEQGTIKAFSSACTHQGCPVTDVSEGTINCACHGSKFRIADGSVANGPAGSPLSPAGVNVDGDAITLG